jgi:hypothetical protein
MDVLDVAAKELLQPRIVLAEYLNDAVVAHVPTSWQSLNVLQLAVLVPLGFFLGNIAWTQVSHLAARLASALTDTTILRS